MSDHFSGPAAMADPASDITDFYAFPSPERPGNLVLIMNVFPMAGAQAFFSDVVTYRFRLRPLTRFGSQITVGAAEQTIDVSFADIPEHGFVQKGRVVDPAGRQRSFVVGLPSELDGLRVFAGLVSDPFFMDVEATLRTDMSGKLSFDTARNTVELRDVLSIAIEIPTAPIVDSFGTTLIAALSETVITRRGQPIRIERVGRPEIKNVLLANPTRDSRAKGIELRDLYNREDSFALSTEYRSLYESRLDANLTAFDALDGEFAWNAGPEGQHPLRRVFIDDFLILDLARSFAPGGFLEIERALIHDRPHQSAGGRWLDDDILDELLTLIVNGERGARFGDGVDAPTKPAGLTFPYVQQPNKRSDLPLPAFLRS
jgi:hypothetical protein